MSKFKNSIVVVAAAFCCGDEFMMARRGPNESGAGEWEFPGGKVEMGELEEAALIREIKEELNFDLSEFQFKFVGENAIEYGDKTIVIRLWKVELSCKPEFRLVDHDEAEWFTVQSVQNRIVSRGDIPFLDLFRSL